MRAGNVAEGVDHRENDEPERERDTHMGNAATAHLVDDNRARPGKDECERAEELRDEFFHLQVKMPELRGQVCSHHSSIFARISSLIFRTPAIFSSRVPISADG